MLSLATLDEVQRHNRDDEADVGSPCTKRTLCSRKRRDEDVLAHSKQLIADPLGPASRTGHEEAVFNRLSPALLPRIKHPQKGHKNKLQTRINSGSEIELFDTPNPTV